MFLQSVSGFNKTQNLF